MSFIRPQARAALWRWREVLSGSGVAMLGLWWGAAAIGPLRWLGFALIAIGIALLLAGLQRARFRNGSGGPGVVSIDERQVTYFGPLSGGSIAIDELTSLRFDPTGKPPHWVMIQPGQPDLYIPVNAEGADNLFDVFATLPGVQTEKMLSQMHRQGNHPVVIWRKRVSALH